MMILREVLILPNIKSAKKRVKVIAAKTAKNKMIKSNLKTTVKKFNTVTADTQKAEAMLLYREAVKKVDQAVAKGILHKNNAARKKSQLTRKFNGLSA